MLSLCIRALATSTSGDFDHLFTSVTFYNGSTDGEEQCVSVSVNSDNRVESEEHFTATLVLVTSGSSLIRGNATTAITLVDSDGKCIYPHV